MAVVTFTELLNQINSRAIISATNAMVTGFAQGLGVNAPPPSMPPQFSTQAHSISWLLDNAKRVRAASQSTQAQQDARKYSPLQIIDSMATLNKSANTLNETPPNTVRLDAPLRIGDMIMYIYDPKTKQRLPYYDTFPLVFPISLYHDGFLGLNMHYLPPYSRAILMDSLYGLINNHELNEKTRLNISYEILNNSAKYREYKPCVKRYLFSHIMSLRAKVDPSQWDMVLMLPIARFVKANELKVWSDSLDKIRGIKK